MLLCRTPRVVPLTIPLPKWRPCSALTEIVVCLLTPLFSSLGCEGVHTTRHILARYT